MTTADGLRAGGSKESLLLTPEEAAQLLRIGRTTVYGLMKAGDYRGYVPIETLAQPGKEYDPFTLVPQFAKAVRQAMAET